MEIQIHTYIFLSFIFSYKCRFLPSYKMNFFFLCMCTIFIICEITSWTRDISYVAVAIIFIIYKFTSRNRIMLVHFRLCEHWITDFTPKMILIMLTNLCYKMHRIVLSKNFLESHFTWITVNLLEHQGRLTALQYWL